ncbi:MAG: metallophosphoesterase family protein [Spirochaetota bacterium]
MIQEKNYNRIIVIGDLHGHFTPLLKMLDRLKLNDGDLAVFIGDYIDRGYEAKSVVQRLIQLQFALPETVFLKGNHEDMLLGSLGYPAVVDDLRTWLYNGGGATLVSYGMDYKTIQKLTTLWDDEERSRLIRDVIPDSHIEFFKGLKLYLETEHFFICHAGVDPSCTIEEGKDRVFDLLWIREHLYASASSWEKVVVCGHTPLDEVLMRDNLICVDTGLHYTGKLSAVEILSKKIYQVL